MALRLLDLFSGGGGAAAGYAAAGFEVVGVDIEPQPRYPFDFVQADAMTYPLEGFDVIHASPPCQAFSKATKRWPGRRSDHPVVLADVRARLIASGRPYVLENVDGAPLKDSIRLCGSSFGLEVRRHRRFELSHPPLLVPPCQHDRRALQVNGHPGGTSKRQPRMRFGTVDDWRAGMGIEWLNAEELAEAIPPAYTEWLGRHLLTVIA